MSQDRSDLLKDNSERTNVVKDFCFPGGVLVKKLDYDENRSKQPEEVEDLI
jgi:hypothetical protein